MSNTHNYLYDWYAKKKDELYLRYQDALEKGDIHLAESLFNEYQRYLKAEKDEAQRLTRT